MTTTNSNEPEALLHVSYLAPLGLVQTSLDGDRGAANTLSAQLLLPLSPGADAEQAIRVACRPASLGAVPAGQPRPNPA